MPWPLFAAYSGLLLSLCACFLGVGMLISALARSLDVAQAAAFLVWLGLVLFLDLLLLGLLIEEHLPAASAVAISVANPLQVFRTASMMLFDPQLVLLGPSAYVILDHFGGSAYIVWALVYPAAVGLATAAIGYFAFRNSDLV